MPFRGEPRRQNIKQGSDVLNKLSLFIWLIVIALFLTTFLLRIPQISCKYITSNLGNQLKETGLSWHLTWHTEYDNSVFKNTTTTLLTMTDVDMPRHYVIRLVCGLALQLPNQLSCTITSSRLVIFL